MTAIGAVRGGDGPVKARDVSPRSRRIAVTLLGAAHCVAVVILFQTEADWFGTALFLVTWSALNGLLIVLSRRPGFAAAVSLAVITILLILSTFKAWVIWTTLNFLDVLIVDSDTLSFVLATFPGL